MSSRLQSLAGEIFSWTIDLLESGKIQFFRKFLSRSGSAFRTVVQMAIEIESNKEEEFKTNENQYFKENNMLTAIKEQPSAASEQDFFCQAHTHFLNGQTQQAMDLLFDTLREIKSTSDPKDWGDYTSNLCLKHAITKWLYQDPFTWRAYFKPRGYAGDAQMIDYIYGADEKRPAPEGTSEIGKEMFAYLLSRPAAVAVRERRRIVAAHIDALARRVEKPRILALAAGCLREADITSAVSEQRLGEFVALDQDPESLAIVEEEYSQYGVTTMCMDIRSLMSQHAEFTKFDFVYATGLFDYLRRPFARRLARIMLSMTNPGGQILIPNFVPDMPDAGYMEAFMDWKLVYRDGNDLLELLDQADLTDYDLFAGENENIVYLLVRKPKGH